MRWKRTILWITIPPAAALVAFTIWQPGIVFLFLALTIGQIGKQHNPPPMAAGIAKDFQFMRQQDATKHWKAMLQRDFPDGTPETTLRTELHRQGFVAVRKEPNMFYHWGNGICESDLIVNWTSTGTGLVTAVDGQYSVGCL